MEDLKKRNGDEQESMQTLTLLKNQLSENDLAAQGAYFCGMSLFPHTSTRPRVFQLFSNKMCFGALHVRK